VLHRGAVVRGEGEFTVLARGRGASRFLWAEVVVLPFGRAGALGWRLARPVIERVLDRALETMRERVEQGRAGTGPTPSG
jgi:hypothetical protein